MFHLINTYFAMNNRVHSLQDASVCRCVVNLCLQFECNQSPLQSEDWVVAAQPLRRHCTATAQTLHRHCTGTAQPRHTNYTATAQLLHSHCTVTAQPCTAAAQTLHSPAEPLYNHCTARHNHCRDTAQPLHSPAQPLHNHSAPVADGIICSVY